MIKTYEDFESEDFLSSKEVADYIKEITPETSDVPDHFLTIIRRSKRKFVLKKLLIEDVLREDPDAKEYVDGGHVRYDDEDMQDSESIEQPIVIFDGEVFDGYSRITALRKNGEKYVDAYVAI